MRYLAEELISGISHFGSGGSNSEEFNDFFRRFKKSFTNQLKKLKANNISFSKGHFYLSGFFKVEDQWFYFSISDVRGGLGFNYRGEPKMLIRTAKSAEDYTGGANNYVTIANGMYKEIAKIFRLEVNPGGGNSKKDTSYYVEKAIKNGFLMQRIPSTKQANNIAWALDLRLKKEDDKRTGITENKLGRTLVKAYCTTNQFAYRFDANMKTIYIEIFTDNINQEALLKAIDKPSKGGVVSNWFTGAKEELTAEAVGLHHFIKRAETERLPLFRPALLMFRERYPKEYMTLLD